MADESQLGEIDKQAGAGPQRSAGDPELKAAEAGPGQQKEPAPASDAMVSADDASTAPQPVTWSFPVEVEVVVELSRDHLGAVAAYVFDELDTALRGIG